MNTDTDKKISLLDGIQNQFKLEEKNINSYPPLTLAYLGDAVFEIIIRTLVVREQNGSVNTLHRHSSHLVNAGAQASLYAAIEPLLTEEEHAVYKRGRNAKSHTVAKNATIHDYRTATGFEALMGYLYLTGQMDRCIGLVGSGLKSLSHLTGETEKSSQIPE